MEYPSVMTPREIVSELDRYIVGQHDAKRAVAIALRNRWRRQNVAPDLRDEIAPKNILMIGPTGVGKTEIARRLAQARAGAVRQGRGLALHRGRLRRPRCRIDDSRPGRDRGQNGARRGARAASRSRRKEAAEERLLDILYPASPGKTRRAAGTRPRAECRWPMTIRTAKPARSCASCCATAI